MIGTGDNLKQYKSEYVSLIQITDTHIMDDPEQTFDGINTLESLKQVLEFIHTHEVFDAMLVTGDLVHDPVDNAYARLAGQLQEISGPVYCMAGNHDDPGILEKNLNKGNISTTGLVRFADWQVCLLNSWMPGTHAGHLPQIELDMLEKHLRESERFTLVALHHPPVSVNSPWMDAMGLENPDELFSVISRHDQVKVVIWGHIHQEYSGRYNQVQLLASPSTCIQFTPGARQYSRDNRYPGYRRLQLYSSGRVESEVIRVRLPGV